MQIRKRASKALENSENSLVKRTAALLGFKTELQPIKKLAAKISKFLVQPDPAICDADGSLTAAQGAADAVESAAAAPKRQAGRKRRSAPAGAPGGRKPKAARGRRGGSAVQAAPVKEDSAVQTMSVSFVASGIAMMSARRRQQAARACSNPNHWQHWPEPVADMRQCLRQGAYGSVISAGRAALSITAAEIKCRRHGRSMHSMHMRMHPVPL